MGVILAMQLESEVLCVKIQRELVCVREEKPLCVCQPGRPHGPLNLRQMWWRSPYIS